MSNILGEMLSTDFRNLYREGDGPDGWMAAISKEAVSGRHLFDKQVDSNAIWFPKNVFEFRNYVLDNISIEEDNDYFISVSVAGHFDDDILEPYHFYLLRKIVIHNNNDIYFEFWNNKKNINLEFSLQLGNVVVKRLYSNQIIMDANMSMDGADLLRIKGILKQFHAAFKAHLLGEDVSHMVRKAP